MAFRVGAFNLSKGEFSEALLARVDVASYAAGAKRARNVIILKYGGMTKRPGTRLVAEVRDATEAVRLIPFQFSLEQTYAVELGQGYMRPAAMGGMVLEQKLTVEAAYDPDAPPLGEPSLDFSIADNSMYLGAT